MPNIPLTSDLEPLVASASVPLGSAVAARRRFRIQPTRGWVALNLREIWDFRDLFWILATRDVRLRYKQTLIGVGWVILQPLLTSLIFAVVFGRLAKLPSQGHPYMLFAFSAMIPWGLFSQSVSRAGLSLISDARLISKVYFPRLILPMSSTLAVLVDFAVSTVLMFVFMAVFGVAPEMRILAIIPLTVLTLAAAMGVSFWISALDVRYRDFAYIVPFLIQLWMYASPVAYSSQLIPDGWRVFYALNPMVGIVEGFRWAFLGGGLFEIRMLVPSVISAAVLFVSGAYFFRRVERGFADVI